jgi:hypothetical protein
MGVKVGVDPKNLTETGWGVILAADDDPAILEALRPLLDLRRQQAGDRFRIFQGPDGYRSGKDSKSDFLARNGVGPGPADPERMPYYLLLAGSFQQIPLRFQVQLDVQYAVGRLHFETPEEYAAYAATVVAAECEAARRQRRVVVFGVTHPDDPHTAISASDFAKPLVDSLARRYPDLQMEPVIGSEASKAHLVDLLHQDSPPGLLITSGHGMIFPAGDPRRVAHQGALLCADWPGPLAWQKSIPPEFYFSADDVTDAMQLRGMIALHYSSFSAGNISQDDSFQTRSTRGGREAASAEMSWVARLAQRLMTHPRGGALAVVGLVERAWSYALPLDKSPVQMQVVESVLMRLLDGYPVGSALEFMNERYAELSTELGSEMEDIQFGKQSNPEELAQMWMANNDARSFAVVGDPAVRLAVDPTRTY